MNAPIIARMLRTLDATGALTSALALFAVFALLGCEREAAVPTAAASVMAPAPVAGGGAGASGPTASRATAGSGPSNASPGPMAVEPAAGAGGASGVEVAASQAAAAGTAAPALPACGDVPGPTVATDIHGTLTVEDYLDNIGNQTPRPGAAEMLQAYSMRGYFILYVTGAPQAIIQETVSWFGENGFPQERAILTLPQVASLDATVNREYKTARLREFVEQGYLIQYAYGDKSSDFQAYQAIGVANDHIFSIGAEAGTLGTVAIDENSSAAAASYRDHVANHVPQLPSVCTPSFTGKPIQVVD